MRGERDVVPFERRRARRTHPPEAVMRDDRSPDVAPWSFFVPIALAVLVGGLAAGLILRATDRPEPVVQDVAAEAAVESAAMDSPPVAAPEDLPPEPLATAVPGPILQPEAPAEPAPAASAAAAADQPPALPGAILAKRDGAPEACIHGTIATREENGWQQRLENDAPVACVEAAPPAQ
jgi:hypothetical protein